MGCIKSSASGSRIAKPVQTVIRPKQASLNSDLTPTKASSNDAEGNSDAFEQEKQRLEKILHYDYELLSVLGKGSCAIVYKARYKKTQEIRALKCSYSKLPTPEKKIQSEKLLENEDRLLSSLSNDRIIRIYETVSSPEDRVIAMEHCQGGRLFDALKRSKSLVNEQIVSFLMEQLLEGVAYLHSKRIIHRDLKMENILLENDDLEVGLIKIIDFGISSEMIEQVKLNKVVGSSSYMAPELLMGNYDEKIDEWACGIIMYILLTGIMPYKSKDHAETRELILTKQINFGESALAVVSPEAMELLKSLLDRDSIKRISAQEALESKWIKNNQACEIHSLEEFQQRSIEVRNFDQADYKALLEVLMIGAFSTKNQDKIQVGEIFRKLDRNNKQMITFEDLVAGVIGKVVEEKKKRWKDLKLKVTDEKISIDKRVFLNSLCKIAFEDDIQRKGALFGYINARESQQEMFQQIEDNMLAGFGIKKERYQEYKDSKDNLSLDSFYSLQLEIFL